MLDNELVAWLYTLHTPSGRYARCTNCRWAFPCPTIQALDKYLESGEFTPTWHYAPKQNERLTRCCKADVHKLPPTDRVTLKIGRITCQGKR